MMAKTWLLVEPIFRDATVFASLLSLMSMGLTLTYMTTKVPNFAHGSFATIGIYISLTAGRLWKSNPYLTIPLAFLLGALAAFGLYRLVLKPLINRGANFVSLMIATIAYDLLLLASLNIYADLLSRFYRVSSRDFILRGLDFFVADLPGLFFITPSLLIALVLSLHLALTKTRFGVAMRATVENPALSGVVGINVNMVYSVSWLLAGGFAGIAGSLIPLWFIGNPDVGPAMLPSIFAASIAGGFLNVYGAVLGGFLVGISEVLGTSYLASTIGLWIIPYRPIIPLAIIVITLLGAPKGLTGLSWSSLAKALQVKRTGSPR